MTTHNLTELKRLFDEACQTTPPAQILALLFSGTRMDKSRATLAKTIKLIEKSTVDVAPFPRQNRGRRLAELFLKIGGEPQTSQTTEAASPNLDE